VVRWPTLLPERWREPRGPLPEGARSLLLVGTGMLELLGWRALRPIGVPEMEVFLELGRELLILGLNACKHTGVTTAKNIQMKSTCLD